MKVFPALAAVRDDGFIPGPWQVQEGSTDRGNASCNVNDRVLVVPTNDSPTARVVRAHELTHAKVSPMFEVYLAAVQDEITSRALECAEEARVNYLVRQAGFDTELLTDGSEKDGGATLGQLGNWDEAVSFMAATINTGAFKPFLSGIRKTQPKWVAPLRAIAKQVDKMLNNATLSNVASTALSERGVPIGFESVTVPMARMLSRAMSAAAPEDTEDLRVFRRSLEPGHRRAPSRRFAELLWLTQPEFTALDLRGSVRKARPSVSGTHVRYPSRLLTDPQKRIMARKVRADGGIVLIDQSGSMDIDDADLRDFARRHPRATLVGYSHVPGSAGDQPNAWILAAKGRVSTTKTPRNVGNGVDGPILRWALQQRQGSEPVVWVCDGQVTDSNDLPVRELSVECAHLVRTGKIRIVRDLDQVSRALMNPRPTLPSEYSSFGRVGRILAER